MRTRRHDVWLRAFPMHGLHKMMREGFRTRDAHLLEWFSRSCPPAAHVAVHSRPEPPGLRLLNQRILPTQQAPEGLVDCGRTHWRVPSPVERRRWWLTSLSHFTPVDTTLAPSITWNPLLPLTNDWNSLVHQGCPLHVDLLDNWLKHPAFAFMCQELRQSYAKLFDRATSVSANSEGTLELASEFGRDDAVLIPNGCDPERFSTRSSASGPTTVGYIGKLGSRVDIKLIERVTSELHDWQFHFAGPILDAGFGAQLRRLSNVHYLGDVPYSRVPNTLETFDIGWVPHGVGAMEVGGDAIKIYEYRAAGLPVVTTPIIGTRERPLPGVVIAEADEHVEALRSCLGEGPGALRTPRVLHELPDEVRWERKAGRLLAAMGLTQ